MVRLYRSRRFGKSGIISGRDSRFGGDMSYQITIIGGQDVIVELGNMRKRISDPEEISAPLAENMRRVVHVITGYLKSTIYHEGLVAAATAHYAAYEARRGGDHDFATRAVKLFDMQRFGDRIIGK